jgi:hypothetical protein
MGTAFGLAAIFDVVTLAIVVVVLRGRPRVAVPSSPASLADAKTAEDQALIE